MKWEYILEIPFDSKAKYFPKKRNCKYRYSGKAYYFIDKKGDVLRDFAQINNERVEIRPNDNGMKIGKNGKGTSYWNQKSIKNIRRNLFPDSGINYDVQEITDKKFIKQVNDYAIENHYTVLSMNGLLTGSNTSGADKKLSATPIISTDSDFCGIRFVNAFKKYRKYWNNKTSDKIEISPEKLRESNKINLKQYFDLFQNRRNDILNLNPDIEGIFGKEIAVDMSKLYFLNFNNKDLIQEKKAYKDNVDTLFRKYKENHIERNRLIQQYRGILRAMLILEKQIIGESVLENSAEKVSNMDAAHLFDVSWIKKDNDNELWKIADLNNGLLLPKDYHWKFDKDEHFDINDKFEIVENGKVIEKINDKYINQQRKEYLLLRHDKLNCKN